MRKVTGLNVLGTVQALRRLGNCAQVGLICNKTRAIPGDDNYGHYD